MPETVTTEGFEDYLPLTAVRTAPGEYDITASDGRVLWRMEGAALAEWVCERANGVGVAEALDRAAALASNPYGDEVEASPADSPRTVGEKIAAAIRALKPEK